MPAPTRRLPLTLRLRSIAAPLACSIALSLCALAAPSLTVRAQTLNAEHPLSNSQQQNVRATLNNSSLLVATSHSEGSYLSMAQDIAAALGSGREVRLVPIVAGGGVENLRDLVFLRGVDMAIVPANVLAHTKAMEAAIGTGVPQRIAHVTHLFGEEVHLLVGDRIATLEGLRRKKVAVPSQDGKARFTARDLFERLGLEVDLAELDILEAIEQVRTGDVSAVLLVGGKPIQLLSNLPKDGRLRFLGLPFSRALEQGYSPSALRAEDYPTLIPSGLTVETIATSAVLMANNAKGYEETARRLAKFVPLFFGGIADLTLVGRHPKWKEVNLAAPLPGWTRLPAADEWLRSAKEQRAAALQKEFEAFLRSTRQSGSVEISPAQRKKLFDDFVNWTRQSVGVARETDQR